MIIFDNYCVSILYAWYNFFISSDFSFSGRKLAFIALILALTRWTSLRPQDLTSSYSCSVQVPVTMESSVLMLKFAPSSANLGFG